MPGLGGDINNFNWIGEELSKRGWPIVFLIIQGVTQRLLWRLLRAKSNPGGVDFFLYRIKDLGSNF